MMWKEIKMMTVALFVLAVIGMWGCSWDESVGDASHGKLIGYISDSLAVYAIEEIEEICVHKPLGEECSDKDKGLFLSIENFYTENVVWKSSRTNDVDVFDVFDLIDDSTVAVFRKSDGSFFKWILGEGIKKMGAFSWLECDTQENIGSIRPWGEGKWRLVGSATKCAYAIADVEKKVVTGFEKLDEFAEGCSDLWMHEGVRYCVGLLEKDTILSRNERSLAGYFFRNEFGLADSLWNTEIDDLPLNYAPGIVYKNFFLYADKHLFSVNYEKHKLNSL